MNERRTRLSRLERLEADMDLRMADIIAPYVEFTQIPPSLFKKAAISAYRLGDEHARVELLTPRSLYEDNGYRRRGVSGRSLPLWLVVAMPPPSDQEIADFLQEAWKSVHEDGFEWPHEPSSFDVTVAYMRAAYGDAYADIAGLMEDGDKQPQ